jgi:hypothetical protein
MAGTDLVQTRGREVVDRLENRNRSGKLTKAEVEDVIAQWDQVRTNLLRANNSSAARAAGQVIRELEDLLGRAD